MDTALGSIARYHGLSFRTPSLGGYLYAFAHHSKSGLGHIPESEHAHFQAKIVKQRNKYMHEAGAFPHHEEEVKKILSEMQACMARIVAL
ncbi:hypothetical protein [Geomonas subterranea]|uniref:hypothetical protein n=1 Tax=Geomonas subterranea TaxID=2847989 RepID=UPI001CD5921F|nr:hypothetical protein [Geomonas fuzhouensis]